MATSLPTDAEPPPVIPEIKFQNGDWPTYADFLFEKNTDLIQINHGSFGATPKVVADYTQALQKYFRDLEISARTPQQVDDIKYELYQNMLTKARHFLKLSENSNIVMDHNATSCLNSILRFEIKDRLRNYASVEIVGNSHSYGAMINALMLRIPGSTTTEISIDDIFNGNMSQHCTTDKSKLQIFIFDYISSSSGILFPANILQTAVSQIKSSNPDSIIIIDAAHAPGLIDDLKIDEINADYFLGNFHKWVYSDKNAAVLWAKHAIDPKSYFDRLKHSANMPSMLGVSVGIDFYNKIGFARLEKYCREMLDYGEKVFRTIPGFFSDQLLDRPQPCTLRTLRTSFETDLAHRVDMNIAVREILIADYNCMGCFTQFDEKIWLRLSANVYNLRSDYERFVRRFCTVLQSQREAHFLHGHAVHQLRTETCLKSVHAAQLDYQTQYHEFPDRMMYIHRRRAQFNAAESLATLFIRRDFPPEKIGVSVDGDYEILRTLTGAEDLDFTKSEIIANGFRITTDLKATRSANSSEFLVIWGTETMGRVQDDQIRDAIFNADAFVAGLDGYMMGPKGLAFIAVNNETLRDTYQPNIISWECRRGFQDRICVLGSRDQSAIAAVPTLMRQYYLMRFLYGKKSHVGEKDGKFQKLNCS